MRPRVPDGMRPIQRVYINSFSSIWEYQVAFEAGRIDWDAYLEGQCAVCGACGCYRQITGYQREAIDLFPWRRGQIDIPRFLCREYRRTFSLLPDQLAPYHRYTVESMLGILLLVCQLREEQRCSVDAAVLQVPGDHDVLPYLVRCWAQVVWTGLIRGHPVLSQWHTLPTPSIEGSADFIVLVTQINAYGMALSGGSAPGRSCLREPSRHYARVTELPLMGIPSQLR